MNVPDLLGVEVLTPDGRGSILSLHTGRVIIHLHCKKPGQKMHGKKRTGELHYAYQYKDVEIIKGQYCFNDDHIEFQYKK